MRVTMIGQTTFHPPKGIPWEPENSRSRNSFSGEDLVEFAGRACYQSWSRPNPATATNEGYVRHILEVGHFSVLEHGVVTFYIEAVSRSLTHELVRHRHFSYSQLSQRYVSGAEFIIPPDIGGDPKLVEQFLLAMESANAQYEALLGSLDEKFADLPAGTGKKKRARQAARSVLPNATATSIVVTGNYRAWRHFIDLRATEAADIEIRALAVECLRQLQRAAPNIFGDYKLTQLEDGTWVAATDHKED